MSRVTYIFAGGGTGGHLFPALAVAQRLVAIQPDARIVFACSDRDIDRRILTPTPYAIVPQAIRPLPRSFRGWGKFIKGYFGARAQAARLVGDVCPAAVLGLGGFAAQPVTQAAHQAGVRVGLMSIDAVPGFANRHLAAKVDAIFTQFASTAGGYGNNQAKVKVIGCPVRADLLTGQPAQARQFFGLRDDRRTLLVMSGSLGAANINQAVARLSGDLDALAGAWQVLHVAGPGKVAEVQTVYAGAKITHAVLEFCDRMDMAYAAADLVLCRAGGASIGELAATGRPAVLLPYPYHRDQHQRLNAQAMASAGAAVVVTDAIDPAVNADALRGSLLAIMRDQGRLAEMQRSAGGMQATDAAGEIARWLTGEER
jgi:UDP-N-acetylglucosamine--N-acetylmuramyl-(pentapeptide) pyrophosphoryl-undecaprenol N-acetylglucosamine transferase